MQLTNRMVMVPLTRDHDPDATPTALMAGYCTLRATAGLIISKATAISHPGQRCADYPTLA